MKHQADRVQRLCGCMYSGISYFTMNLKSAFFFRIQFSIMKTQLSILITSLLIFSIIGCNNTSDAPVAVNKDSIVRPLSMHNAAMMQPMDQMMARIGDIKLTGDYDYDFANVLIEHNRGSKGMAALELAKGSNENLSRMARQIIQRAEDTEHKLISFLKIYKSPAINKDSSKTRYFFQIYIDNTIVRMKGLFMSGDIDKDFIVMMIPHHEASNEILKG